MYIGYVQKHTDTHFSAENKALFDYFNLVRISYSAVYIFIKEESNYGFYH